MHCDHEHTHEHTHSHEHIHTPDEAKSTDPREEIIALVHYMVHHNAHHAEELSGYAKKLDDLGEHDAYKEIMEAVKDFEQGNCRLSAVLTALNAK